MVGKRWWCAAACTFVLGCGGSNGAGGRDGGSLISLGEDAGGGGMGDATIGEQAGDGGTGSAVDAGGGSDPVDAEVFDAFFFGRVNFETLTQNGNPVRSLVLEFAAASTLGSVFECGSAGVQSGGCCYQPPSATAPSLSAGTVAVFVGDASAGGVVYTNGTGYAISHPVWMTNDVLEVSAQGGVIEPFTATTRTPDDVQFPDPLPAQAHTGADLQIRWTPATPSEASRVLVELSVPGQPGEFVKCTAPDGDGAITLPAALLARLSPADAGSLIIARTLANTSATANATVETVGATGSLLSIPIVP